MIGTRLAHYEITAHVGSGGMGDVYQATDSKLGRSVAVKCLPEAFAHDADRVARFQREARVLASLNHSNIAGIYGIEETGGRHFLVMEFVPGETLADRIAHGPIPIDEALGIARQITDALEAAHDKGILHRDLKPANIKITDDGKVKVLDFGLAKILSDEPFNPALSNSPTMMSGASLPGVILGTASYMSPEQSRGKVLDKRTDVWAFGIVLFEMLTGRRVFSGETATDVIGAIAHKDPDWAALPLETPEAIRRLLRRCLAKDVQHRLRDIADARLEIEAATSEPVAVNQERPVATHTWLVASVIAVAGVVLAFGAGRYLNNRAPVDTMWTSILPPERPFNSDTEQMISPDGRTIAFTAPNDAGKTLLWLQPLDSPTASPMTGTEGSFQPFWSPDNRSLGFFANSKLQRIDVSGGAPQVLADAPVPEGGAWASDGTILFAPNATTIHRVAATGGPSTEVTHLDAAHHESIHGWPSFLPDQKHFLLWVFSSDKQNEGVYVGSVDSGELQKILPLRTRAQYANGYLFFGQQASLMAQRFDPDKLQLSGEAIRVAEGLGGFNYELSNRAFSVSSLGTIAWWGGNPYGMFQPTWFDRSGRVAGTLGEAGRYLGLYPSPDGKYIATDVFDFKTLTADAQLLDPAGGNPSRLTFVNYWAGDPVWSPDSRRILYTQWRDRLDVVSVGDSTADQIPFPGGNNSDFPLSWSPDGQNLLVMRGSPATGRDLWILPMSGDHKPRPYLSTPATEGGGRISPDGHWVAYASDESGRSEVFVQSFPVPGNKKRISTGGGLSPNWRKDGRELFFVTDDHVLMAVNVTPGPTSIGFSAPARLFQNKALSGSWEPGEPWTPSLDGQRFLVLVPVEDDKPRAIHLITNWKP